MDKCKQASQEDLKKYDLKHYDELATKSCHWTNSVPKAINFYYDYKKASLIQKLLLAFKTKRVIQSGGEMVDALRDVLQTVSVHNLLS